VNVAADFDGRGLRRRGGRVPPSTRLKRGRPSVLLVDDLPDQREIYVDYLRQRGFEVVEASSGVEAIAKSVELGPDVVVMDLSMPGIDGFEATRVLKAIPQTRNIPIVALTAYAEHLPPEWAVMAGCDVYLKKPLLPADLETELRVMLRRRSR
jgi:CheY-like chemotaxis protein